MKLIQGTNWDLVGILSGLFVFKSRAYGDINIVKEAKYVKSSSKVLYLKNGKARWTHSSLKKLQERLSDDEIAEALVIPVLGSFSDLVV